VTQAVWKALTEPENHQGFWIMVGALAGAVSAVIILVAALVARSQLREARVLRESQTRPFVLIEYRVEASSLIYLRIANLGSTMARKVRFTITPGLVTTRGDQWNVMALQSSHRGSNL
jgi:hypothetical protein